MIDARAPRLPPARLPPARLLAIAGSIILFAGMAIGAPPPAVQQPGTVRVRLITSAGAITVALDARHAPKTTANFLAYVDDGRYQDTTIYRAARRKADPRLGFIQGGIGTDPRRMLPSVPLEPTSRTGLHHLDGTISMAHGVDPDSGHGNFTIQVGDNRSLDAKGSYLGYAAFGQVISGMDVVKRILAMPTGGGRDVMRGQMILQPVRLIRIDRIDGTPHPTGRVKPWLLALPKPTD